MEFSIMPLLQIFLFYSVLAKLGHYKLWKGFGSKCPPPPKKKIVNRVNQNQTKNTKTEQDVLIKILNTILNY